MEELLSGEETRQENQLSEFTTMLCIGDEDYIRSFDMYTFCPIFLDLLSSTRPSPQVKPTKNNQVRIMSTRAIGLILNIVPQSCPQVVSSGAVPVLIEILADKNLNAELAEDALKCLDKISIENPQVLLKEKTFMITLLNSIEKLRNFSNGLVKPALSLIGNLYRKLTMNNFQDVVKSFSVLAQLFQGTEEEAERVCDCFAYLLDRFGQDEKKVQEIASSGLASAAVSRLARSTTSRNCILRLLSKLTQSLPQISLDLCQEGIIKSLRGNLSAQHSVFNGEASLQNLIASDVGLSDALYLLLSLLPPLFGSDIFAISSSPVHQWFWEDDFHNFTEYDPVASGLMEAAYLRKDPKVTVTIIGKAYEIDLTKMQQYNKSSKLMRNVTRMPIPSSYKRNTSFSTEDSQEKTFSALWKKQKTQYPVVYSNSLCSKWEKNVDVVTQLFTYLVDPLIQICSSSVNLEIKQDCAIALGRIFYISTEDALSKLNRNRMVGFLCKLFQTGKKDLVLMSQGCLICDILLARSKENYAKLLMREGFVQLIKELKNEDRQIATLGERFLGTNFKQIKEEVTDEEKKLAQFCKQLTTEDPDVFILNSLLANDQISKFQFTKMNFADAMNQWIAKDTKKNPTKLVNLFLKNPETMKRLVNLLNFSLESIEQLEATTNTVLENFNTDKNGRILEQPIKIIVKSKDKALDLSATPLTMEPLATIGALQAFIFKKIKVNVDVSIGDTLLSGHQTLLEVLTSINKVKFLQIPSQTATFMLTKASSRLNMTSPEDHFVRNLSKCGIATNHPSNPYFTLLCTLYHLNRHWKNYVTEKFVKFEPIIPAEEFVNHSISSKLTFQLQTKDSLFLCAMGLYPTWIDSLVESCRFLFSFELRRLLFYVVNFGTKSLNAKYNPYGGTSDTKIGRKPSHRVVVNRETLLKNAIDLLNEQATAKSTIEIEYENERGFGSGPSLAFYSLVSQEMQKKQLGLFLDFSDDDKKGEYVLAPNGLFPNVLPNDDNKIKVLQLWKTLGQLVGKALEDNRLLDTQFSHSFIKLCMGEKLKFEDFAQVDIFLYNHLKMINDLAEQKAKKQNEKTVRETISNLFLDFTYKGHEICPKGSEKDVTYDNIEVYVKEFVDFAANKAINQQCSAFLSELQNILPLHRLRYFTHQEVVSMISGGEEKWDPEVLKENIQLDGYQPNDKNITWLIEVLCEMAPNEKTRFVEFATGSTRLPIGGIKNLNPKLTIVKVPPRDEKPDLAFPMVNTCFHYLKLPVYSSKKIMLERLQTAINNSTGFTLT